MRNSTQITPVAGGPASAQRVPPSSRPSGLSSAGERAEHRLINRIAASAEAKIACGPEKLGWLAWFGRVLRGQKGLLYHFREIAQLWPPLERAIFELLYIDGVALSDIALMTGCTAKAFHARLQRVQLRLRQEMIRLVLLESKASPDSKDGANLNG